MDPISLSSGLLTLVVFAFQSSKVLYDIVDSFQSNKKTVRGLKEELEALNEALQSLQELLTRTDVDLSALKKPLLRCGKACKDFEAVILKCTANSKGDRTSFRDWARLQYMGSDIDGFRDMLAGYKSTIIIALGDANMRTSAVTVSFLKEYKELITNTTSDLQEHLEEIDRKLQAISVSQNPQGVDIDTAERQRIQEERDSTQQCLEICAQVHEHIDRVRPIIENVSTPSGGFHQSVESVGGLPSSRQMTSSTLKACRDNLSETTKQLERNLQAISNRLQGLTLQALNSSPQQSADQRQLQEELDSIRQCLDICSEAATKAEQPRINIFEDVSMTDDGSQVIVSTIGDLISAKRITAGARSMQLLGQMSDESVQHLSRNRNNNTAHNRNSETSSEPQTDPQFLHRYGTGFTLNSRSSGDVAASNN